MTEVLRARENETFRLDQKDADYLTRLLGGRFERRHGGYAVCRLVGQVLLPSRRILVVHSQKAPDAGVLAWAAYADPRLAGLRMLTGALPLGSQADLTAVTVGLFLRELMTVVRKQGLRRDYQRVRVRSSTIRGRIDFHRLASTGGDVARMPCVSWERLPETPLNRLISAALACVDRIPGLPSDLRRLRSEAGAPFAHVPPSVDRELLSGKKQLGRLEAPYELVLALALMILAGSGIQERQRGEMSPAFFINIERLFEMAVARALEESPLRARAKVPAHYMVQYAGRAPERRSMEMDVFFSESPVGPVVVDAKYKTRVSSSNIQQMTAYCLMARSTRGLLILPAGHVDVNQVLIVGPPEGAAKIGILELDTSAADLAGWQANANKLAAATMAMLGAAELVSHGC